MAFQARNNASNDLVETNSNRPFCDLAAVTSLFVGFS